jgi:hypothetical protein
MSNNGKAPLPFAAPAGTPIVGQPFTLKTVGIPMNATLSCNCGGADTEVTILLSAPAACPSCGTMYGLFFNPQTMQVCMNMVKPQPEGVPS